MKDKDAFQRIVEDIMAKHSGTLKRLAAYDTMARGEDMLHVLWDGQVRTFSSLTGTERCLLYIHIQLNFDYDILNNYHGVDEGLRVYLHQYVEKWHMLYAFWDCEVPGPNE